MRYQVPQFIEVEDKIFGPLTLKQFVYLAGGGGLCLAFFTLLPFFVFVILAIPVMGLSLALAFYRVNDRPFITAIEHAFGFYTNSKLYLWKQRPPELVQTQATAQPITQAMVPKLSESRLKDLAWSLNIKEKAE
ncbi:PrgI family protein [Patescibacteria group bacterium]|nr:PrgI family protein [Patescibacteria group bacterium]